MKYILFATIMLIANVTFGQTVFKVDNFSKNYSGKIIIQDTSEVFSAGSVAIHDKKTGKELIKVTSEELALTLHDGKAKANINELPYGEQSLIIYEDFNFDGIKDFAIEDGHNSCYHGASFKIYLATKTGFTFNKEFTRLAQEYCGMFQVNYTAGKLNTMTKSGCCWHQFSEFIVEKNTPKAIKITEEDHTIYPFSATTTQTWNGKKMITTSHRTLDRKESGIDVILSFKIEKDKEMILFANEEALNYALIEKNGNVELTLPRDAQNGNTNFILSQTRKDINISFENKAVKYKIYEFTDKTNKIGIEVNVNGKIYNLKGYPNSKKGKLNTLFNMKTNNVFM